MRENDGSIAALAALPQPPAFLLMKAGIFERSGRLKFVASPKHVMSFCQKNVEMHAWVAYKLADRTQLTRAAGQRLGQNLNQLFDKSCFASVELDIEPLSGFRSGLQEFLEEVRRTMRQDRKLLMALAPVGPPPTKGQWWNERDLKTLLGIVDGVDFMLYDTGLERGPYVEVLKRAVAVAKTYPDKQFRLGLPAYYDKNRPLHPLGIENTTVTYDTLRDVLKEGRETLCSPSVRVLYYAYWTMKREDLENAGALDSMLKERCAERPKSKGVTPLR